MGISGAGLVVYLSADLGHFLVGVGPQYGDGNRLVLCLYLLRFDASVFPETLSLDCQVCFVADVVVANPASAVSSTVGVRFPAFLVPACSARLLCISACFDATCQ